MEQNIPPTKGSLLAVKNTLDMARLGYSLLDQKRNVLIHEIMELSAKAHGIQARMTEMLSNARGALRQANALMGEEAVRLAALDVPEADGVVIKERGVMGVPLPEANIEDEEINAPPYGLSGTATALDEAAARFRALKSCIVELATVENTAYRLAMAIKKAQKRANALNNIMIPNNEAMVKYISETLEERDRDEFTRLKKSKEKVGAGDD
ncbi:MAG: V-type ATP synthase subunit D [Clostridiales bacterium]|jgi:V/A-type H+-transporting ATPase subunit D|nr:V-type ATP synthase subunit D [Clostridiales bacterium]